MRTVVDAPWFVRNSQLHRELKIKTIDEFTKKRFIMPSCQQLSAVAFNIATQISTRRLKPRVFTILVRTLLFTLLLLFI